MLPEEIQNLVDTTLQKPRRIIQMFEEELPLSVGYSIQVAEPNDKSRLTEWEYDYTASLDAFWTSVEEDIQDILTYTQQLSMAQEFHSVDIKLLLETVTKHLLWHSEYPSQDNDFELRAYISKGFKKPTVPINKELHWELKNWDDIMAFMIYRMHLDRGVHTVEDLSDLVQQGIGSYR